MATLSQVTPHVSMVDTDQEKALLILTANFRNHSVGKNEKRRRKKEKKNLSLQELTNAVLNAAFYKTECQVLGCSNPVSLFIFGCLW